MDWELLSFILRSKRRKEVILALNTPKTPSEIASKIKVSVSHVSRTLNEFTKKGLVRCKTPQAKIGRVYVLTDKGKDILKHLKK